MITPIEWTDAEREAVTDICTHEGLGKACDRCWDTISDALIALAPFVAERERQAAARALYHASNVAKGRESGDVSWLTLRAMAYSVRAKEVAS